MIYFEKYGAFVRAFVVLTGLAFWALLGLVIVLLVLPFSWNEHLSYPFGKALEFVCDRIDGYFY